MSMRDIKKRLNELNEVLEDRSFIKNRNRGGELNFYIFDYDPEHELIVRDFISYIPDKYNYEGSEIKAVVIDLYELMIEILNGTKIIDKTILDLVTGMEEKDGKDRLSRALKPIVSPENFNKLIAQKTEGYNLVVITGVGKIWPFVRSHNILNNLQNVIEKLTVVMFYPGLYDQHELCLFNLFKDDNYYRAFRLV